MVQLYAITSVTEVKLCFGKGFLLDKNALSAVISQYESDVIASSQEIIAWVIFLHENI